MGRVTDFEYLSIDNSYVLLVDIFDVLELQFSFQVISVYRKDGPSFIIHTFISTFIAYLCTKYCVNAYFIIELG